MISPRAQLLLTRYERALYLTLYLALYLGQTVAEPRHAAHTVQRTRKTKSFQLLAVFQTQTCLLNERGMRTRSGQRADTGAGEPPGLRCRKNDAHQSRHREAALFVLRYPENANKS